jgi:nucleoside-diphosphate-sugar epimerase
VKQYLVTGGAGFIGSHIVRALLDQGASVRVLDNFSTGKRVNLEGMLHSQQGGRLEILEGDLCDPLTVAHAVRGVEVIFHEAAFVSVPASMAKPQECFDVNISGTNVLFEVARKAGVRRTVIASSAAVYGDSNALPLLEETAPRTLSPYAVSKRVNEMIAELYTRSLRLEVAALRYFNVYGPRQRPDSMYAAAVPIFISRLREGRAVTVFGDGGQTRDLIFVGDVVRANLIASEHPAAAGQIFNVCTGRETRILDLLEVLYQLIPNSPKPVFAEPRAGDIYKSLGDPAKASKVIGFTSGISLAEGLKETVEWKP